MLKPSPLVKTIANAASSALGWHFLNLEHRTSSNFVRVLSALAAGFEGDLDDRVNDFDNLFGFDHRGISIVFADALNELSQASEHWVASTGLPSRRRRWGPGSGLDKHIWSQDYDRGIWALLSDSSNRPTREEGPDSSSDETDATPTFYRTRASSVTQQCLLTSRRTLDPRRSIRSARQSSARLPVPSPLWIARDLLTDPDYPSTVSYAEAALRALIFNMVSRSFGRNPKLDFGSLTSAYEVLINRERVSRGRYVDSPETAFICHFLAMKGILDLYIPIDELSAVSALLMQGGAGSLFELTSKVTFRLNARYTSLPRVADLLTEITGLKLPIEGLDTLFRGAVRLSSRGDLVTALSGTFGTGKTSFCLGLAAALAPLGARTLFLTFEEEPGDLEDRLQEALPENLTRSTPPFAEVALQSDGRGGQRYPWFFADRITLPRQFGGVDAAAVTMSLTSLLEGIFSDDHSSEDDNHIFSRPMVIVIDGLHALFSRDPIGESEFESALSQLIDFCRSRRAIFIFTAGDEDRQVLKLEYLCDLVLSLGRNGFEELDRQPTRVVKLLKARRQAVRPGAHVFHLTAPRGLRIKPSLGTLADEERIKEWSRPDPRRTLLVPLVNAAEGQQAGSLLSRRSNRFLQIRDLSQVLVRGLGSSGKSALALSLLHRRPVLRQASRKDVRSKFFSDRGVSENDVGVRFESRVLIVSFLYQAEYYSDIRARLNLGNAPSSMNEVADFEEYNDLFGSEMNALEATSLTFRADVLRQDVVALYPGSLSAEDFLFKVMRQIKSAELRGIPYTGILIDGIHNVFLQFSELEKSSGVWPQFFSFLRRRSVRVVTTHTDFHIGRGGNDEEMAMLDIRAAQAKAAPLLSVLVSAGDYVLDVMPEKAVTAFTRTQETKLHFRVIARETLDDPDPTTKIYWDRNHYQWIRLLSGRPQ